MTLPRCHPSEVRCSSGMSQAIPSTPRSRGRPGPSRCPKRRAASRETSGRDRPWPGYFRETQRLAGGVGTPKQPRSQFPSWIRYRSFRGPRGRGPSLIPDASGQPRRPPSVHEERRRQIGAPFGPKAGLLRPVLKRSGAHTKEPSRVPHSLFRRWHLRPRRRTASRSLGQVRTGIERRKCTVLHHVEGPSGRLRARGSRRRPQRRTFPRCLQTRFACSSALSAVLQLESVHLPPSPVCRRALWEANDGPLDGIHAARTRPREEMFRAPKLDGTGKRAFRPERHVHDADQRRVSRSTRTTPVAFLIAETTRRRQRIRYGSPAVNTVQTPMSLRHFGRVLSVVHASTFASA
jgi:hypothetical protein